MSHHLIWCACGLTVVLALCAPGGHGLHTGARGLPGPAGSPVLATVRVGPNPVAVAVDPRSRHVLVVNGGVQADANGNLLGPGSVSLLDATTGAVLRTVPAGRG